MNFPEKQLERFTDIVTSLGTDLMETVYLMILRKLCFK